MNLSTDEDFVEIKNGEGLNEVRVPIVQLIYPNSIINVSMIGIIIEATLLDKIKIYIHV